MKERKQDRKKDKEYKRNIENKRWKNSSQVLRPSRLTPSTPV